MLAERVLLICEDILNECKILKIRDYLTLALQCASLQLDSIQRANLLKEINTGGSKIVEQSRTNVYSKETYEFLRNSTYGSISPQTTGRFLSNFGSATSQTYASEVNRIIALVDSGLSDMTLLSSTLRKLNIKTIKVDSDCIALDFSLPLDVFGGDTKKLLETQESFCDLAREVSEYVGNDQFNVPLVCTSTSTPLIAIATYGGAAVALLKLYAASLKAAQATIELREAVKLLNTQPAMQNSALALQESLDKAIQDAVRREVTEQLSEISTTLEEGRRNELTNAIVLRTSVLVPKIAEGASLGISVESLEAARSVSVPGSSGENETLIELAIRTKSLEKRTKENVLLLKNNSSSERLKN